MARITPAPSTVSPAIPSRTAVTPKESARLPTVAVPTGRTQ